MTGMWSKVTLNLQKMKAEIISLEGYITLSYTPSIHSFI